MFIPSQKYFTVSYSINGKPDHFGLGIEAVDETTTAIKIEINDKGPEERYSCLFLNCSVNNHFNTMWKVGIITRRKFYSAVQLGIWPVPMGTLLNFADFCKIRYFYYMAELVLQSVG